ncbi:hypothetical protein F3J02_03830 [Acinetobacter sp. Tr-809]|uniref:hypothetical protein n=1 Tax=Acinetobacter sp. Tr-809 TaxID=2608324 RepID=UPI001422841C|nr:hypothetical protein [Acinetobacter sp. Tr-809]NIE95619.1 hypothetical protein [Acinetobacter sp. Tr-809]
MTKDNPINQTHLIIASITASFAKALDKTNPGFKEEFLKELGERYHEIKDYSHPHTEALETLTWTRDFLNKE